MAGAKRAARSDQSVPLTIYRLKIQLRGVKPVVWRRIEIAGNTKLPDVSRVMLMTISWTDTHLHAFRVGRQTIGPRDPDFADDMLDERRYALEDLLKRKDDRLVFDYDFGDNWQHDVTVESIRLGDETSTYPRCLAGKRNCPPEDCGGPYGYAEFLRTIADPTDPSTSACVNGAESLTPTRSISSQSTSALLHYPRHADRYRVVRVPIRSKAAWARLGAQGWPFEAPSRWVVGT